ncbi:MAG: GYD domain-containing protein [Anaerolineae bacterium]
MPKYLIQANYVGEGVKGFLKDGGSKRRAVVEELFRSMGATIEAFYYAFGDTDVFIIGDFPDHATVAATCLAVTSTGTVTWKTTVLLTPEELDEATKKKATYSRPGQELVPGVFAP